MTKKAMKSKNNMQKHSGDIVAFTVILISYNASCVRVHFEKSAGTNTVRNARAQA